MDFLSILNIFATIFVWLFLSLAAVGAAIILFAFVLGVVRGIKQWFQPRHRTPTRSVYTEDAGRASHQLYKELISYPERRSGFMEGAAWAWQYLGHK